LRNIPRLWRKVKIAAGIVKAMSKTHFDLTTPLVEIAAVRSKNEFLEVPISIIIFFWSDKSVLFKNS
jgi:hypothetical protein